MSEALEIVEVDLAAVQAVLARSEALLPKPDYELLKLEDFCLYPNDYTDEGNEFFCTADFAGFFGQIADSLSSCWELIAMINSDKIACKK